jgi:hypothetical protein
VRLVEAAAANFACPSLPFITGKEGAGVMASVGPIADGDTEMPPGDVTPVIGGVETTTGVTTGAEETTGAMGATTGAITGATVLMTGATTGAITGATVLMTGATTGAMGATTGATGLVTVATTGATGLVTVATTGATAWSRWRRPGRLEPLSKRWSSSTLGPRHQLALWLQRSRGSIPGPLEYLKHRRGQLQRKGERAQPLVQRQRER